MVIKKICYVGLIFFLLVSLTSCKKEIPDGEIKDFVLNFDFDKSYENTLIADSLIESSIYKDGVLEGSISIYTYIDHSNLKYHYSKTIVSGIYYGTGVDQFNYKTKETIIYIIEDGNDSYAHITEFFKFIKAKTVPSGKSRKVPHARHRSHPTDRLRGGGEDRPPRPRARADPEGSHPPAAPRGPGQGCDDGHFRHLEQCPPYPYASAQGTLYLC